MPLKQIDIPLTSTSICMIANLNLKGRSTRHPWPRKAMMDPQKLAKSTQQKLRRLSEEASQKCFPESGRNSSKTNLICFPGFSKKPNQTVVFQTPFNHLAVKVIKELTRTANQFPHFFGVGAKGISWWVRIGFYSNYDCEISLKFTQLHIK